MERKQSIKLERKSSLEEPRTMSKKEYELALTALKACMKGHIEEESSSSAVERAAVQPADGKPPLPKPTKEAAGTRTGTGTGTGTRREMKLPVLA